MNSENNDADVDEPEDSNQESSEHGRHCFVVMPYGRTTEEIKWFEGWYEVVIEPAVRLSGYDAVLSAAEEQPGAINDEIRAHLAFDPMVVVDLGGANPKDPPNPNVMYELGIRHAFGLPVVILAWEDQELPFDVGNQRAIMTGRQLLDLEPTKKRLTSFITAASEGRYYNPMEAVGREATIEAASAALGEETLLGALTKEIRELRSSLIGRKSHAGARPRSRSVRSYITKKTRKELWWFVEELGLDSSDWGKILTTSVPDDMIDEAKAWDIDDWKRYLKIRVRDLPKNLYDGDVALPQYPAGGRINEKIVEAVANSLPPQPWPTGIHKEIASELSITNQQCTRAITELIRQGRFLPQIDGTVYEPTELPKSEHDPEA